MTLNDPNFYLRLAAQGGWSVVVFGSPGCGACRRLKSLLPALGEALPGLHLHYAEAEQNMGVLADLEVFHLPAIQLYAGAEPHAAISAELNVNALADAILRAKSSPPTAL